MIIHDHFDGSVHCVECGGVCKLEVQDLKITQLVRFSLEALAMSRRGNCSLLGSLLADAVRDCGGDPSRLWRRACVSVEAMHLD